MAKNTFFTVEHTSGDVKSKGTRFHFLNLNGAIAPMVEGDQARANLTIMLQAVFSEI